MPSSHTDKVQDSKAGLQSWHTKLADSFQSRLVPQVRTPSNRPKAPSRWPHPYASASRFQPKAACSGCKNRLHVYGTIGEKLVITPTKAAPATPHPG